jgi:hypothetical protein
MDSTSAPTDAAVRKMIKAVKKRGYVTHEQVNAVLSSEEFTPDKVEDVFVMLSEICINVVEEAETEGAMTARTDTVALTDMEMTTA